MIRNGVCFFAFFLLLVAGCAQVVSMDDAEDDAVSEETDNRASSKKDKKTCRTPFIRLTRYFPMIQFMKSIRCRIFNMIPMKIPS